MYKIVLESINIFQYVPGIMSHLYLCMWHYCKDKFIIWWEVIALLHAQMSPSYCYVNQIFNSLLALTPWLLIDTKLSDPFPLVYYLRFFLTQAAILFCLSISFLWKKGLCPSYLIWIVPATTTTPPHPTPV